MYPLRLKFHRQTDPQLEDLHTLSARLRLVHDHNIHCVQTNSTVLVFEHQRDQTIALLLLSNESQYSVMCE